MKEDVFESAKIKFIREHTRFKNGYYEYRVTKNGISTSKSAKDFTDLVNKILHPRRNPRKKLSLLLSDYIETYMKLYRQGRFSQSTEAEYKYMIGYVTKAFPNTAIDRITTEQLQNFINSIQGLRVREKVLSFIKKIFSKAYQTGKVKKDAAVPVQLPYVRKMKKRLTLYYDEQIKLLDALKDYDLDFQKFVMFSLIVGSRREETVEFKLSDINIEKGSLTIHGTKTYNAARTILISPEFIDYLLSGNSKGNDDQFFDKLPNSYYHRLKRLYAKLGFISDLNVHALRHTCSANLHYLGVSDKRRQQILGHSSITTTNNIYTELEHNVNAAKIKNLYGPLYFSDYD